MRISGGDARGIRLKVPKGARPAGERVRQAVLSSLGHRVLDARVLDLYCGSGAYGLEALSRGASAAVFVDNDPRAVEVCRANVEAVGVTGAATIRRSSVERYLARYGVKDGPFDIVFADPPYAAGDPDERVLERLGPAMSEGACVLWEMRKGSPATGGIAAASGWVVEADRRYGDTRVVTFVKGTSG